MSYARFSQTSDVYIFPSRSGAWGSSRRVVECCACTFAPRGGLDTLCTSTKDAIAHVEKHQRAGHQVPDNVISDLNIEQWCETGMILIDGELSQPEHVIPSRGENR